MHGAKNMIMKASHTQNLGLCELKQHKPWCHEEYLQPSKDAGYNTVAYRIPTKAA